MSWPRSIHRTPPSRTRSAAGCAVATTTSASCTAASKSQDRTAELLSLHIIGNEAAFLARLTVTAGDSHTRIDGIDVMTFDDQARITSMRAFWSVPEI